MNSTAVTPCGAGLWGLVTIREGAHRFPALMSCAPDHSSRPKKRPSASGPAGHQHRAMYRLGGIRPPLGHVAVNAFPTQTGCCPTPVSGTAPERSLRYVTGCRPVEPLVKRRFLGGS